MSSKNKKSEKTKESLEKDPLNQTAIYVKDPKTGLWIVKNPCGSIAYNYLYRNLEDD